MNVFLYKTRPISRAFWSRSQPRRLQNARFGEFPPEAILTRQYAHLDSILAETTETVYAL